MTEGVKLYKHFSEQLNKMGRPRRAWFTTFNLDVSFFEKYILSALMGSSYKDLQSAYDYEALNAQLANEETSLTDDKMEVRVFYDFRALVQGNKPKQTSVHLHPIDIKQLSGLNADKKFTDGVFHPKVTLIETVAGEYWLMVSSANLTFGGWANNRESFFCDKIEATLISRDIGLFFQGIISSIRNFGESPLLNKLTNGKFGQKIPKWYFFSSFNQQPFLVQLNNTGMACSLRVWSPYYAGDLDAVTTEIIEEEYFDKISIIPAKNENQKIRITEQTYLNCLASKQVSFHQDKLPAVAIESFVHAKVWLTPIALAVGSWNMTSSGMNISKRPNNNVEAGIVYAISSKEYEAILENHTISSLRNPAYYSQDELDEEKDEVIDEFQFSIDMVADWDKLVLKLVSPTFTKLASYFPADCLITLPGIGRKRVDVLEKELSFREHTHILLTDRYFELNDVNGKTLYKGYLREEGLLSRPVNSFSNIDDFLKGWVSEKPEERQELFRLAYKVEEEFGDELSVETRKILMSDDQNAWFSSFHAFECIIKRVNEVNSLKYKVERIAELKRIGRVLPGSLSELSKHLNILKEAYLLDPKGLKKSPVYLWFLIEKANIVFRYFNTQIGVEEEHIKQLKNIDVLKIFQNEKFSAIEKEKLQSWIRYIKSKLQIV